MEFFAAIASGIVGLFVLSTVILWPFKRKYAAELRQKSKIELENMAFCYADDYFSFIGHDHPEVLQFKELIRHKDLKKLKSDWGRLNRAFRKLERKAGHSGRPLIMDYYCWHEMVFRELEKRNP
jgi:hypothetical protein